MLNKTPRELSDFRKVKEERFKRGAKKRVAIATRVSDKKQAKIGEEVPIPVQRQNLLKWIDTMPEWEPAIYNGELLEYTEVGSAYKISRDDRVTIQQSIADAENDLYDIIVFFKHDRLSRISEEYTALLRDYWSLGVEPWDYEKKQSLSIKTQTDKLLRTIEGIQSETESANTSYRVTQHMQSYASDGIWMGGKPPYGYISKTPSIETALESGRSRKKIRMGIEIYPEEAEQVKHIFNLYTSGYGASKICRIINNPPYNYRKRNGKPFDASLIMNIIKNPIYIGLPAWGKTSYREKFFQRIPEEEWIFPDNPIEEYIIIEPKIWALAQKYREERWESTRQGKTVSRRSLASERLLAGLGFCGYCKEPMVSHTYKKGQYKLEGYICRNKRRKTHCEARINFWRASSLDSVVIDSAASLFKEQAFPQEKLIQLSRSLIYGAIDTEGVDIKQLETKIRQLKMQKEYYVNQHNRILSGEPTDLPEAIIREQLFIIQDNLDNNESKLKTIHKVHNNLEINEELLNMAVNRFAEWENIVLNASIEEQKNILIQITNSIELYDEEIIINYNLNINKLMPGFNLPDVGVPFTQTIPHKLTAKTRAPDYKEIVRQWEKKENQPFGEILVEVRRDKNPEEAAKYLGVSTGFLYYHYPLHMNRINYLEDKYQKSLKEVIIDMRDTMTMDSIAQELGLSVSTLYLHLRKE